MPPDSRPILRLEPRQVIPASEIVRIVIIVCLTLTFGPLALAMVVWTAMAVISVPFAIFEFLSDTVFRSLGWT